MAEVPTHVTMFVGTSADAYEECARVSECWRCAITFECSPEKRAQYERQNAMAETIAKVIRDKSTAPGPKLNDLWRAAREVCRFDWTDADFDADNAMTALQDVVASMLRHGRRGGPELPPAACRAVGVLEDCGQIERAKEAERERVARVVCAAAIGKHGGPEDDEARQMTVDDRWHAYLPEADAILGKQPICRDPARYNRGECCGGADCTESRDLPRKLDLKGR